jgi:deoxyadenosine/deoxycytidine kinase
MARFVVLIEGNICAGKTTLIDYIQKHPDRFSRFLKKKEEVKTIVEFIDHSWLQLFYRDRQKYTSWFEKSCLIGRIGRHFVAKAHRGLAFFDRGMVGGASTFCRNSFEEGYLRYDQWLEYQKMLRSGLDDLDRSRQEEWLEGLLIYLKVDDATVLQKRNRIRSTEGEVIPAGYLDRINRLYETFIENVAEAYTDYGLRPPRVLTLDASVDFLDDQAALAAMMDRIVAALSA